MGGAGTGLLPEIIRVLVLKMTQDRFILDAVFEFTQQHYLTVGMKINIIVTGRLQDDEVGTLPGSDNFQIDGHLFPGLGQI